MILLSFFEGASSTWNPWRHGTHVISHESHLTSISNGCPTRISLFHWKVHVYNIYIYILKYYTIYDQIISGSWIGRFWLHGSHPPGLWHRLQQRLRLLGLGADTRRLVPVKGRFITSMEVSIAMGVPKKWIVYIDVYSGKSYYSFGKRLHSELESHHL